jgi:integrase
MSDPLRAQRDARRAAKRREPPAEELLTRTDLRELPDALAEALEATLLPREDRQLDAPLFPESGSANLRMAITRACKAAGVPHFHPHDLRHRRVSLLHLRGMPWARIAEHVGQRDLAVTANTYTHVLGDETEVDYGALLPR